MYNVCLEICSINIESDIANKIGCYLTAFKAGKTVKFSTRITVKPNFLPGFLV